MRQFPERGQWPDPRPRRGGDSDSNAGKRRPRNVCSGHRSAALVTSALPDTRPHDLLRQTLRACGNVRGISTEGHLTLIKSTFHAFSAFLLLGMAAPTSCLSAPGRPFSASPQAGRFWGLQSERTQTPLPPREARGREGSPQRCRFYRCIPGLPRSPLAALAALCFLTPGCLTWGAGWKGASSWLLSVSPASHLLGKSPL